MLNTETIGARYQLVACANCGGAHHVQQCGELRAALTDDGADIQAQLDRLEAIVDADATIARLREEIDEAHQHIGALVAIVESSASECQDQHFDAWLSKNADRRMWLAVKLKHMNATLDAVRTWLRREAK